MKADRGGCPFHLEAADDEPDGKARYSGRVGALAQLGWYRGEFAPPQSWGGAFLVGQGSFFSLQSVES